jgi:hypothetical protein
LEVGELRTRARAALCAVESAVEDEAKRSLECALGLGRRGDVGAVSAATASVLGMRASEIAERIVRDLDAGGTKLRITSAKTAAGVRTMKVPPVLQPPATRASRRRPPAMPARMLSPELPRIASRTP